MESILFFPSRPPALAKLITIIVYCSIDLAISNQNTLNSLFASFSEIFI